MKKKLLFTVGTIGTLAISLSTFVLNKNFARYSAAQETAGSFLLSSNENAPTQNRVPYEITSTIGTVGTAMCNANSDYHSYADFSSSALARFAFTQSYGTASFIVNVRGIYMVTWDFDTDVTFDVKLTLADGQVFEDDALNDLSGIMGDIEMSSYHLNDPVISIEFLFNGEVSEFSLNSLLICYDVDKCLDSITNYSVE